MRRFILRAIQIALPIMLFLLSISPFYLAAFHTGEFNSVKENIEAQINDSKTMIGIGYNEQTPYYKLVNANNRRARIITIGPSRVMQYKGDFFLDGTFYNCGGCANYNFDEYLNFLKNLNYTPEIILFSIDMWVFNDSWNKNLPTFELFSEIRELKRDVKNIMIHVVLDYVSGKWNFSDLDLYPDNIGFNGRIKDAGFMNDGSYYYGYVYRNPKGQKDYQFKDTLRRISTGTARFEWGDHVDSDTLKQLDEFLSYCTDKGITAIGILAPFAPHVYSIMYNSKKYAYLREISPSCEKIFAKYENCEFYDYHDANKLGVTDTYFLDGFHGSEIVYGLMIQDIASKGSAITKYVDMTRLNALLTNAYSHFVFKNSDERYAE